MSDVSKLKELLFGPEREAIARLDQRIDVVYERAGSDERFEASVTRSLDGALRSAETQKHAETATALAPLVVKTVKTEIRNSTDDIVEAIYPSTGRIVKAYVSSAIRELLDGINRKLEQNALMMRLTGLFGGASPAEVAFADSQQLKVAGVLLVRRGTGELLGRWPVGTGPSNLDHVLGGVLTAINEFTSEAFNTDGTSLRQIDLGDQRVYLRVSPTYLLAARCTGTPPAAVETVFDEEFLALTTRHKATLDSPVQPASQDRARATMLADLNDRLERRLAALAPSQQVRRRGMRPLTLLAWLIGVPLALWLGWVAYTRIERAIVAERVEAIIDAQPEMVGYPTRVRIARDGTMVTISGLTPSAEVEQALLRDIAAAVPGREVRDELNPVPMGADPAPMFAELRRGQTAFAAEVRTAADRQRREQARAHLTRATAALRGEAAARDPATAASVVALATAATALADRIAADKVTADREGPTAATESDNLAAIVIEARRLQADLETAARATLDTGPMVAPPLPEIAPRDIVEATERVAVAAQMLADRGASKRQLDREAAALKAETERLRHETGKLEAETGTLKSQTGTLRSESAALRQEADALRAQIAAMAPRPPTPRERLEAFTKANAVFFSDGTTFREPLGTGLLLDDLADLMKTGDILVRVIGYTDETGTATSNQMLAQSRAEIVRTELLSRGVAPNRLVALRRTSSELAVSPVTGTGSANRRVEFQVGFIGEGG